MVRDLIKELLHAVRTDDNSENIDQPQQDVQGSTNGNDMSLAGGWVPQENSQIGMVSTLNINPSPSLVPSFSNNQQAMGQGDNEMISVPKEWAPFLKGLLQSPAHQIWAKNLIEAGLHNMLLQNQNITCTIPLMNQPPTTPCKLLSGATSLVTGIEEALPAQEEDDLVIGKKRARKSKVATPIVESAVRRSARIQAHTMGFKTNTCSKDCPACATKPPTLSHYAIKKIGTALCQLKEDEINELTLTESSKLEPISKKSKKGDLARGKKPGDEGSSNDKN